MKTWIRHSLHTVLAVIFCCSLFVGCDNNANVETPSEKQSRFIAVENARLKRDIQAYKNKCEKLLQDKDELHAKEINRLNIELDKCKRRNKSLSELSDQGVEAYMSNIVGPLADRVTELEKENEALKAQIQQLKNQ
jgi:outer membrane murein-binding lipoprotein Lpp